MNWERVGLYSTNSYCHLLYVDLSIAPFFFLPAITLSYKYQLFPFTLKVGVIIIITNILQLHLCLKKRD